MKDNNHKLQVQQFKSKPQHIVGVGFKDFNSVKAIKSEIERLKEAKVRKNV